MNKTWVALAALAAVGTASAQSSLTLFGVLDAAVSYYDTKSTFYSNNPFAVAPLVAPSGVTKSKWAMSTGGLSGSRLGFRGTEDLGGGLAASFWLESGLANDAGLGTLSGGAFGFNRRSTVSLSGGFGEIRLGRDYTPTYTNDLFEPFVNGGVGATLFGTVGGALATARGPARTADYYTRVNNSIGYFLPPTLNGFYGQLMYGLPENTKLGAGPQTPTTTGRYHGGRFGYASGPLDVAIAYGSSQSVDAFVGPQSVSNKFTETNIAATYDFGPFKLYAELMRMTDRGNADNPATVAIAASTRVNNKYNGGLIGVTVPLGVGLIRATYAKVRFTGDVGVAPSAFATTATHASSQKLTIGYVHNLSKRTALYATVAKIRIKDGQNDPAVMGATTGGGLTYLSTGAGVQGYAPRSSTGYDFGIRHSF